VPAHAISIGTIISHIHPQPCYYSAVILSIMPKIARRILRLPSLNIRCDATLERA